ncbi:MAG: HAD family phosphatase [Candidatus Thermoplasmatota archaeon]|nr:HAD family phosphatase [Candidatus Thermoplasmatota archaeon]
MNMKGHSDDGHSPLATYVIKGVIFDFGNVLCSFDNVLFTRRLAERSPVSEDEIHRKIYEESELTAEYETGKLTSIDFYHKVKELCDLDMGIDEFRDAFTDIFTPIPGNIELIRKLKCKVRLGLLSNTNEWDRQYALEKLDVYPLFDAVTFSNEVGAKKPDERIYLDCLGKLGLQAQECLYIDDIEEYVKKAMKMGFIGFCYEGGRELGDFLRRQGCLS